MILALGCNLCYDKVVLEILGQRKRHRLYTVPSREA